jgi:sugar/nucleoside kinase (ribokinase family)
MKKALVLGGVSFDSIIYLGNLPRPEPQTIYPQGFHETVGETGAGKALNLCKLDMDVTLHGLVGLDYYGEQVREYLSGQDHLSFVYDVDPKGTPRHVNLMDAEGRRISISVESGSFEPQVDRTAIASLIAQRDYIALNILNYCRYFIPLIKGEGKEIWCDIHDYDGRDPYYADFTDSADYLFVSSDALPDYRGFMEKMVAEGRQLVVCTHGKEGSTVMTHAGEWIDTPIIDSYKRVDTNGAGDAFFAGFLFGHSRGYSPETCARLGTVASGLCITSRELAFPGLSAALLMYEYSKHYGSPGV